MKTPEEYAASGSEHAEQVALFMWAAVAARYGYRAAADPLSYSVQGHTMTHYGPRRRSGCGTEFVDTRGPEAVPELADMFAIPNGGERNKIVAGRLKAEGVKRGVPDVFLPVPRGGWHGLFLELKRRTTGSGADRRQRGALKAEQSDWIVRLRVRGYGAASVTGFVEARDMIISYLSQK